MGSERNASKKQYRKAFGFYALGFSTVIAGGVLLIIGIATLFTGFGIMAGTIIGGIGLGLITASGGAFTAADKYFKEGKRLEEQEKKQDHNAPISRQSSRQILTPILGKKPSGISTQSLPNQPYADAKPDTSHNSNPSAAPVKRRTWMEFLGLKHKTQNSGEDHSQNKKTSVKTPNQS